jgi:aminoglycoside phosphotransferase (APT) family kinase protein
VDVGTVVAAHLPGYRVGTVALLGAGQEHVAYEINGELIVRLARQPDPDRVRRDGALLAVVARVSPVPVPEPVFVAPDEGCLAYRKLPGVALLDAPRAAWCPAAARIAAPLGDLLAALHAVPVEAVAGLVEPDDPPLEEWRGEAAQTYPSVAAHLPARYRPAVEAFLAAPPPPAGYPLVFSHNDLGIEHVLVDPAGWTVSGVIDWTDAALVDPAVDIGLLYRDLGPAALAAAPGGDAALAERAVFYARCALLEDLAYGIATGLGRYVAKSRTALSWLFPA